MNSFLRLSALNLIAIVSLVIIVFPFFLVIVTLGMASAEAYALWSRWKGRREKHYGARE